MTTEPTEARPLARPLSGPRQGERGGVRQATYVEMHRAQAEVIAAVMAAREMPRDTTEAVKDMKAGCGRRSVASRAFYRYTRGGKAITGPTIQLMRFLASCWGNLQYGVTELSRDADESQVQAWCWDLQKNNRPTITFIVPHGRISNEEYRELLDPRDVYENNANMGARRLRETIKNCLPPWFVDEAIAACRKVLAEGEEGEEVPEFPVRLARMVEAFSTIGITRRQLEDKQGRSVDEFTPEDLATLTVVYTALRHGETTRDEEFPPVRVLPGDEPRPTTPPQAEPPEQAEQAEEAGDGETDGDPEGEAPADAAPSAEAAPAAQPAAQPAAAARRRGRGRPSTEPQRGKFLALLREGGFLGMTAALYAAQQLAEGVEEPRGSLTEFSTVELSQAINTLEAWQRDDALADRLNELLPAEDDAAWGPVEAARTAYLAANGRSTDGDSGGGGADNA